MGSTTILILGGATALVLLVIGLIVTASEERSLVDDRLEYLEQEGVAVVPKKQIIGEWVGKQATKYTWGQSLTRSLARADIKMKVGEFVLVIIVLTFVGGLFGWFLSGGTAALGKESPLQIIDEPSRRPYRCISRFFCTHPIFEKAAGEEINSNLTTSLQICLI